MSQTHFKGALFEPHDVLVVPFAQKCNVPVLRTEDVRKYFGEGHRIVEGLNVLWLGCTLTGPNRFNVPEPTFRLSTDDSSRRVLSTGVRRPLIRTWKRRQRTVYSNTAVPSLQRPEVKLLAAQLSSRRTQLHNLAIPRGTHQWRRSGTEESRGLGETCERSIESAREAAG